MPKLLDLFCGAGGCSVGYHRAGFEVVGVDINPMPRYPFRFIQDDALEYVVKHGVEFDAIHASPPCQRYSVSRSIHGSGTNHADMVGPCRELLEQSGNPWVMENVIGAPLRNPVMLCGQMFGLGVLRHRLFEANFLLMTPTHPRHPAGKTTGTLTAKRGGRGNGYSTGEHGLVCVAGNNFIKEAGARAMGIDWMSRKELAQAIPPAYTEYIGRQLLNVLNARSA